jgi:hypothetical protein
MLTDDPMEVDPIDGGPKQLLNSSLLPTPPPMDASRTTTLPVRHYPHIHQPKFNNSSNPAEEARQCLEKLRGNILADRVEAAHCLDRIARVLGEERTRNVSQ